jgi:hypothetical protein
MATSKRTKQVDDDESSRDPRRCLRQVFDGRSVEASSPPNEPPSKNGLRATATGFCGGTWTRASVVGRKSARASNP